MKTIKKLFNEIQNKNPHWSSLVCFNMTETYGAVLQKQMILLQIVQSI